MVKILDTPNSIKIYMFCLSSTEVIANKTDLGFSGMDYNRTLFLNRPTQSRNCVSNHTTDSIGQG